VHSQCGVTILESADPARRDSAARRHVAAGPRRLVRRRGRILARLLTFPYYLIPGAGSYTAILAVARLARVARVLMATRGLRRLARQLGKVVSVAVVMLTICSLAAYEAASNPEFASIGDAFWWGITTLTTVGYGDIVPETTAGRLAGVALMLTGVGVVGLLAGSLAEFFHLEEAEAEERSAETAAAGPVRVPDELTALQGELRAVERRLADLAERTRARWITGDGAGESSHRVRASAGESRVSVWLTALAPETSWI
jgi:voltage-gated potassium channel